jgi:hypothetical protein
VTIKPAHDDNIAPSDQEGSLQTELEHTFQCPLYITDGAENLASIRGCKNSQNKTA